MPSISVCDAVFVTPVLEQQPERTQVDVVRRSLFAIATAALGAMVAVYLVAVRTSWGQRLDTAALKGRKRVLSRHDIRLAQTLHTHIDIAALALLGGAILVVALLRGRRRLAVGIAVIIAGSLMSTEVLKHLLPRPVLIANDPWKHAATFPSGHTTHRDGARDRGDLRRAASRPRSRRDRLPRSSRPSSVLRWL